MKIHYVPAGCETNIGKEKLDPEKLKPEYLLINASGIKNNRQLEKAIEEKNYINSKGKKLIVDSGGFQLATGVADYFDAKKIVEIQNKIGDIGFILDVPPFKKTSGTGAQSLILDLSNEYFKECLEKTRKNIKEAKNVKKQMEYYFINQGATLNQLQLWYNELINEDKFDGIATKATTTEQLLLGLMFVESKTPFTKHHILGIGSMFGMIVINYFYSKSRKNIERVTYDSTSSLINSSGKRLIIPFLNKTIPLSQFNDFHDIDGANYKTLKEDYYEFFKINTNRLYQQHYEINAICRNEEVVKDIFTDSRYKEAFQIIDYFFENNLDIEKTIHKFHNVFISKEERNKNTKNLFSFT